MTTKTTPTNDKLTGMKSICDHMNNISEATALKWAREYDMPIKKVDGIWCGSKKRLDKWFEERMAA